MRKTIWAVAASLLLVASCTAVGAAEPTTEDRALGELLWLTHDLEQRVLDLEALPAIPDPGVCSLHAVYQYDDPLISATDEYGVMQVEYTLLITMDCENWPTVEFAEGIFGTGTRQTWTCGPTPGLPTCDRLPSNGTEASEISLGG